jgi:hypothetical protein
MTARGGRLIAEPSAHYPLVRPKGRDPSRRALFRLLVTAGPAGLPAGVIAERRGVSLRHSLSTWRSSSMPAGLITDRRLSRQLIYSAEYGAINALLAYLTENCCGRDAVSAPVCDRLRTSTDATAKTTAV